MGLSPAMVAQIGVRLISIYTLIPFTQGLSGLLSVLPWLLPAGVTAPAQLVAANAMRAGAMLALAVILWLCAGPIGRAVAPPADGGTGEGPGLAATATVGSGLVGIVLAVLAAGGVAEYLTLVSQPPAGMPGPGSGPLWGAVVQFVLGLGLFFGRGALGRALCWARRY